MAKAPPPPQDKDDVQIVIPRGLYESLQAIGDMRDVHPETIIRLHMMAYVRAYLRHQLFQAGDVMPYGQYKGALIEDVIKVNPRYIHYLIANSDTFKLDKDALELLETLDTGDT
jgi:hypothetical protein